MKKRETFFSDNKIFSNIAKISKTSVIEKNIPGGSLGPRMLLESGHFVRLMQPNGPSFHTSHWEAKMVLKTERKG